jgi:hypothetical protein
LPKAPSANDLISGITKIVSDLASQLSHKSINDNAWFEMMEKAEVLVKFMPE